MIAKDKAMTKDEALLPQFEKCLGQLASWLDKAEANAASKKSFATWYASRAFVSAVISFASLLSHAVRSSMALCTKPDRPCASRRVSC